MKAITQKRKTAEARRKDLQLAMLRIQRGRSQTGAKRISIASVAKEAGVSAALIHNHYPGIAEAIRVEQGREHRAQKNAKDEELKQARARSRELRKEIEVLRIEVAKLASINEVLSAENEVLRSRGENAVVPLRAVSLVAKTPPMK